MQSVKQMREQGDIHVLLWGVHSCCVVDFRHRIVVTLCFEGFPCVCFWMGSRECVWTVLVLGP